MASWTRREVLEAAGWVAGGSLAGVVPMLASGTASGGRRELSLDAGWRFQLGDASDAARDFGFDSLEMYAKTGPVVAKTGHRAEVFLVGFDDSGWQVVDVPHDWAVGLPFANAPENQGLMSHGWKGLGRGYPAQSVGWYRRSFVVGEQERERRVWLHFEGVMRDCVVMVNGYFVGRHESGYVPARWDVTDFVEFGVRNVVVVRVDATQGEGWFYEGAGIYRHVWLVVTDAVHVVQDGVSVTTELDASGRCRVRVSAEIACGRAGTRADEVTECRARVSVVGPKGRVWAAGPEELMRIGTGEVGIATAEVMVEAPLLWDLEHPHLYRAVVAVEVAGVVRDQMETVFGIRTIRFDAEQGFLLNGRSVKIQGTSNHQDHAGVGVAVPDAVQEYRVRRLQAMGCNGYRSAHNPPSPALLEVCDRLGMLVMVELRSLSSAPYALGQLETIVRRDRNHPSVILWSLGNEEQVVQENDHGVRIVLAMKHALRRLDASRPCTVAMNEKSWGRGITGAVDVQGFNYASGEEMDRFHRDFPHLPVIGTETASMVSTRGVYENDVAAGYVSAYDVNKRPWSQAASEWVPWYGLRRYVAGGFAWTGFDYRGEPSPYWKWPDVSSHFGILDSCGFFKDSAWYYKAWWGREPVLHLLPHWEWAGQEGKAIEVWVHSNLEEVELELNGVSLGRKAVSPYQHLAWRVAYAPGKLEAVGYRKGVEVMRSRRVTGGVPAKVKLTVSKEFLLADGADCVVVDVEIQDGAGEYRATSDVLVEFEVTGPAVVLGVGNGNPTSLEPDVARSRRAFNGLCQAVVKAGREAGRIELVARSAGLESGRVTLECRRTGSLPSGSATVRSAG